MTLPDFQLTSDTRGLPALKIDSIVLPLTVSVDRPVTDEMAESLLDRLRADYTDQLPDTWATQAVWDKALSLQPIGNPLERIGRLALSIYGWQNGAIAANQTADLWLRTQLSGSKARPGVRPETIWTIAEGRLGDTLRVLGAVANQARAHQIWLETDRNHPAGSRGGHQEIYGDKATDQLGEAVSKLQRQSPAALWLQPNDQDWTGLVAQWRPEVLIDPWPLNRETDWRRLKLELSGRRLPTTLWLTDELLGGSSADADLVHGVCWQPLRYATITELISVWQEAHQVGLRTMLVEPETISRSSWLQDLAGALQADYLWLNRP